MPPDLVATPFLLLPGMSQAVALCHHLVSGGQLHHELLLDALSRVCSASSKSADGGDCCHHGW